ncbi:glycosyltransferase [Lyngbya confervoides]|uniref:Glycosyltransferase n=1 Tax=Lyngbya confervoides BDU141951 TaxID=1574623 RepID=A0ABD4SXK4_9CYAN|nr:glycosyltransferase [Lyngbya confervoides]MCM1981243.1 glycosyltransferase [Lyngbya confervoides BDU141951]
MTTQFPRLLLVSDAPLCQEGTGINRTLVNLLKDYPADKFMLYTSSDSALTASHFRQNVAAFSEGLLPFLRNRLGTWINVIIAQANLQLIDWLPIPERKKIESFAPELILICPGNTSTLLMGAKVSHQLHVPHLIYLMDDWVDQVRYRWWSGSVQRLTHDLLADANGWLMISRILQQDLEKRYGVHPKRSLVVHNPVDLSTLIPPDFTVHEGTFKVVYAGSIWTMHYDAVAVVAEAIFELKQEGYDIELFLHTPQQFWDQYRQNWKTWQVSYGGMIPYHDLQHYLQRADLLLVASSFTAEHAHVTRSSVQTKLTDYMASGRPVFCYGPDYSACNNFVLQWHCGLVCAAQDISTINLFLKRTIDDRSTNQNLAKVAFDVVSQAFDRRQVSCEFYQFINESLSA